MKSLSPTLLPQYSVHFQAGSIKPTSTGNVSSTSDSTVQSQVTSALKTFGFNSFAKAIKSEVNGNSTVFSPFSIALAMSMVLNGSNAGTKTEINDTLAYQGLDIATVNKGLKAYVNKIQNLDPDVKINIANALWASVDYPIQAKFSNTLKTEFAAEVSNLDFSNPKQAIEKINTWISGKTNGLIPQMLTNIDPKTIAALVNTTYLNAKWLNPFNAADNFETEFTTANGPVNVNMMTQTGNFQYNNFEKEGFEAIKLPYGENKKMSMVVLLPKDPKGLSTLAAKLDAGNWDTWVNKLSNRNFEFGRISLPKHEVEYEVKAKEMLEDLGIKEAFNSSKADFTDIFGFKKPYISEVKHKAVLKVNEKGTEAAAATYVGFALESCIQEPQTQFNMNVNHGFISILQDEETHTPLFISTVDAPKFIESEAPVENE
jgi:serine protease inhibitor